MGGFATADGSDDRRVNGEPITRVKSRIERRRKADLSMMPEGIVAALTPKEVASLLACLDTLRSK